MIGIKSYGAYIPLHRLAQADIAKAYDRGGGVGELAVANFDEDTVTMGVEASVDCLKGMERSIVDTLFFATTSPPYREKQSAAIIAQALDLKRQLVANDLCDSLRSGNMALNLATGLVASGKSKNALVVASEVRKGFPGSEYERVLGDAAGALLVGDTDVIASLEAYYCIADEITDVWRMEGDPFVKSWEDRFVFTQGYNRNIKEAIVGLMKKQGLQQKDISKIVFYAPDARNHQAMAKGLGFDPKTQVQDGMFGTVGNTGAAATIFMMVAALESAKPGDMILLAGYGDGADAFLFKVTPEIEKCRGHRGVKGHINSKKALTSYNKMLRVREISPVEMARRPVEVASAPMMLRDRDMVSTMKGVKCKVCGRVQFPKQRVCYHCRTKDQFELYRLSDKTATVFTFCVDHLAATIDPPVIKAIVDFEGGGRTLVTIADRDVENVKIGTTVEMAFRRIHDAMGFRNYIWKSRLVRG
ncbi:MAG: 3-oxoacyl-[acyl-carrier-protein] synthase III C-terminal domain-containing protein [Dehalococcoidia bacterium]|nr:3-oxoacyl-[acyl-carrier-protein] synthase III C-terminal domain-containing protein [Dehalococcoidia bacterium]